jgi:hypothetical protein
MVSSSEISAKLSSDRYSPLIIPDLESFLKDQASGEAYDFEANRTLVKLYQFFPAQANAEYQLLAATLALIYGNESDVGAILCLIPESVKSSSDSAALIAAVENRDACLFANLFDALEQMENIDLQSIASLVKSLKAKNSIRASVLETLSLAYKNASTPAVLKHLNLKTEADLKALNSNVIQTIDATTVTFTDNADNTKRNRSSTDGAGAGAAQSRLDYAAIGSLFGRNMVVAE